MANDLIKTAEAARLLGVQLTLFNGGRATVEGFPPPVGKTGNTALYSRRAVLSWAKDKNAKALFSAGLKARNAELAEQAAARLEAFNRTAVAMISCAFLPPAQRDSLAMRKMTARIRQPKTTTVRPVHDWMDEKEHQPQKANYRR